MTGELQIRSAVVQSHNLMSGPVLKPKVHVKDMHLTFCNVGGLIVLSYQTQTDIKSKHHKNTE